MVKKFFIGVAVILAVYATVAWGIVTVADFGPGKIKGLYFSGILATINVVVAFVILKLLLPKDAFIVTGLTKFLYLKIQNLNFLSGRDVLAKALFFRCWKTTMMLQKKMNSSQYLEI